MKQRGAGWRRHLRGNRDIYWCDRHIAGVGREGGCAGGICTGRVVVITTRRLSLVFIGIPLVVMGGGSCTPIKNVSRQDVLNPKCTYTVLDLWWCFGAVVIVTVLDIK